MSRRGEIYVQALETDLRTFFHLECSRTHSTDWMNWRRRGKTSSFVPKDSSVSSSKFLSWPSSRYFFRLFWICCQWAKCKNAVLPIRKFPFLFGRTNADHICFFRVRLDSPQLCTIMHRLIVGHFQMINAEKRLFYHIS